MRNVVVVVFLFTTIVGCDPKQGEAPLAPTPTPTPSQAPPPTAASASAAVAPQPTELTSAERTLLLQKTLDLDALTPYWHDKSAGFRIAESDVVKDKPTLSMFGSAVVYIAAPDMAKLSRRGACTETREPSLCSFRFTKLVLKSDRTVIVDFEYPREGVVGHVSFEHDSKHGWVVANRTVAER
jgi:hypothetical protein